MKETLLDSHESLLLLGVPTPVRILLKKIEQWPSHVSVFLAVVVQLVGKAKPLA
jgi:hypothetical protein